LKLSRTKQRFTIENLQRAHEVRYARQGVDVISMVKHAVDEGQPLLTAPERVDKAFKSLGAGKSGRPEQDKWLDGIRAHMEQNLSIDKDDFDLMPVLSREGGWSAARKVFGDKLEPLIKNLNEGVAI